MSWEFLLATLVVVASPGTGALYTVTAGLSGGAGAGVRAAFGCTLGIVPHAIAAVSGAAGLFHASDTAFRTLTLAGAAYLLFMAWSMLRAPVVPGVRPAAPGPRLGRVIGRAVLVNLLNPKLSIFFLAFLPQFVGADDAAPTVRMVSLALVFMAVTFVVFAAYGVFASALRRRLLDDAVVQRRMRRVLASLFALLALQLAFSDR